MNDDNDLLSKVNGIYIAEIHKNETLWKPFDEIFENKTPTSVENITIKNITINNITITLPSESLRNRKVKDDIESLTKDAMRQLLITMSSTVGMQALYRIRGLKSSGKRFLSLDRTMTLALAIFSILVSGTCDAVLHSLFNDLKDDEKFYVTVMGELAKQIMMLIICTPFVAAKKAFDKYEMFKRSFEDRPETFVSARGDKRVIRNEESSFEQFAKLYNTVSAGIVAGVPTQSTSLTPVLSGEIRRHITYVLLKELRERIQVNSEDSLGESILKADPKEIRGNGHIIWKAFRESHSEPKQWVTKELRDLIYEIGKANRDQKINALMSKSKIEIKKSLFNNNQEEMDAVQYFANISRLVELS